MNTLVSSTRYDITLLIVIALLVASSLAPFDFSKKVQGTEATANNESQMLKGYNPGNSSKQITHIVLLRAQLQVL